MREVDGIHSRMPSISLVSEMWFALHGGGFSSRPEISRLSNRGLIMKSRFTVVLAAICIVLASTGD